MPLNFNYTYALLPGLLSKGKLLVSVNEVCANYRYCTINYMYYWHCHPPMTTVRVGTDHVTILIIF